MALAPRLALQTLVLALLRRIQTPRQLCHLCQSSCIAVVIKLHMLSHQLEKDAFSGTLSHDFPHEVYRRVDEKI